jgi:membrane fusion protein, multidrug efflux system
MDNTQLQQALLQLESLEKDYHRLDTLRKVGSVSQQQFDQVRTQYDMARSNVAFLRENTRMLAPFSGMVSGKYYENGEMFSGAPNTAAGKAAIISLVQISQLKAVVNVAERYYPYIKTGMDVSIQPDLYQDDVFSGRVMTVYPVIDPLSRTFKIEISIPNGEEKLRPGMFARAILEFDQVQAFVVPSLAILKLQGSNERYVFLEEDGVAKRLVVEIGDRYDDMVELIADEIQEGDRLIIAGQSRLLDGMAVDVVR